MEYNVDDSDRSSSTPPTPTDKPLRSKRSHRKGSPPPGSLPTGSAASGAQHAASPGSTQQALAAVNPMSSAQSTPDPSRSAPFFSTLGTTAASPPAVNGNNASSSAAANLAVPSPHQPQQQPESASRTSFFDPVSDEQRPTTGDSSSRPPRPPPSDARNSHPENGDTEMTDASAGSGGGFTAVNNNIR